MKAHDTVMIYHDPITRQKPEGRAVLLHKIDDLGDGLERWTVCFEGEDGGVYERTVKAEAHYPDRYYKSMKATLANGR